jgi:LmbE family N-acetylglucosaminyl deacetylase
MSRPGASYEAAAHPLVAEKIVARGNYEVLLRIGRYSAPLRGHQGERPVAARLTRACCHDISQQHFSHGAIAALVRVIRQVRPQWVVTWSPEWNWQRFRSCHPDHLATGAAVLTAIYPDAGNPFALSQLKEQEGP